MKFPKIKRVVVRTMAQDLIPEQPMEQPMEDTEMIIYKRLLEERKLLERKRKIDILTSKVKKEDLVELPEIKPPYHYYL